MCLSLLVILCSQVYHWNWKALDFKGHVSLRSVAAENKTRCIGYGKPWELENNKCEKRFPNTLIIGVTKGGTFALMWFLSQHPQIVHNHDINEYFFFAKNYQKGLQWYKENMPYSLPGQVVIDKSANYFAQKETPARVFQLNPSMKCILSVRHPVKRAISEYAMHKYNHEKRIKTVPHVKFGEPFPPFEKIWKRYLWFYYDTSLENWLKFFSLEQIHIVDSDAFSKSPVKAK